MAVYLLRQGHFLLLMDGLNELPTESAKIQLSSFRQDYSKFPMIFTTRDLSLGGDLGIERKLEMQPLTGIVKLRREENNIGENHLIWWLENLIFRGRIGDILHNHFSFTVT